MLRAYRNTLSRNYTSRTVHGMKCIFGGGSAPRLKISGWQMLGPTYDYVHRLLNFSLADEDEAQLQRWRKEFETRALKGGKVELSDTAPRVLDILRQEGLLEEVGEDHSRPCDVYHGKASAACAPQCDLANPNPGGYRIYFRFGPTALSVDLVCPTPPSANWRYGSLEIMIDYPLDEGETWYVGEIFVTEVEGLMGTRPGGEGIGVGYGCVIGRNDTKAIAMSVLDRALTLRLTVPPAIWSSCFCTEIAWK